jgi:hypothetical protein
MSRPLTQPRWIWSRITGTSPLPLHCLYIASTLHCCRRPVSGGVRIPPSGLRHYRATHQYLGPGCLCPLLEPLSQEPAFTEAAIYLTTNGRYQGEYVAECAKSRCGYLGQSRFPLLKQALNLHHHPVPLERMYPMRGVPVKEYLLRG